MNHFDSATAVADIASSSGLSLSGVLCQIDRTESARRQGNYRLRTVAPLAFGGRSDS